LIIASPTSRDNAERLVEAAMIFRSPGDGVSVPDPGAGAP
jgi:hypothetical protein